MRRALLVLGLTAYRLAVVVVLVAMAVGSTVLAIQTYETDDFTSALMAVFAIGFAALAIRSGLVLLAEWRDDDRQ